MGATKELPLESIRIDGGTQPRAELSIEAVDDYATALVAGTKLPPGVVFFDGSEYWLAEGFHRYHAHAKACFEKMRCAIISGTVRDAILHAVGSNSAHGLRRTNADKRKAVTMLLNDKEWARKSDRWIAEKCGVSHPFVIGIRHEVVTVTTSDTRTGKDGKDYPAITKREVPINANGEPFAADPSPAVAVEEVEQFDPTDWDMTPARVDGSWSLPACLIEMRPMVAKWARLCPERELPELAQLLRDFANQVEQGNWNER